MARTSSFPGETMDKFDPSLTDRGGAYVGMANVGTIVADMTVMVDTSGNHRVTHSLKATPTLWFIRPKGGSVDAFIAFPSNVTATDQSSVYYTAHDPWTAAGARAVARYGELVVIR